METMQQGKVRDDPDALLARWINSLTGKMNGEVINGVHDTRSPDQSAWDQVLLHAAACSIGDPFLFVCVRGHEQWFKQPDCCQYPDG